MDRKDRDRRIDRVEFTTTDLVWAHVLYSRAFGWTGAKNGSDDLAFDDGAPTGAFERVDAVAPVPSESLVILSADDRGATEEPVVAAAGRILRKSRDIHIGRHVPLAGHETLLRSEG